MKINRKKVIICITICILIINVIVICTVRKENNPKENDNNNSSENIKQEEKSDDNKENIENAEKEIQITTSTQEESEIPNEEKTEIIEETGKQGDSDLYEIQEGEDSVKIATIKSSVKYKVAFAGMIKNKVPEKEKLDDILEKNHPKYAGIWIKSESQSEFLKYISSVTKSEYEINENGYLKIKNKKNQNEYDKKIEEIINENIDIIEKNIQFLNDLKFEDAKGIFEMYPDLFMNFPKKFEEKILKLKDQLGENYVEIIENDTSVVENII